ncbi:MAG TPA: glycoside hydrolase family 2 TIM barrel-domain containing protein [Chitinophagaceae bacterium]|nr:glycoside hydrolase family 2 TIM barrel-domain containing protein [Chitinophagaceae bacterium]
MRNMLPALLLLLYSFTGSAQAPGNIAKVKIVQSNGVFQLLVDDKPYFIKGAVGSDYLEKLKQYGGNSIRTNSEPGILDRAKSLGLTALVNLPVRAERDGMNYDDTAAVRKQHEKVMDIVRKIKTHPAVIMWALGNELDFIQANVKEHYNVKVWDAVDALAKEIHTVDPYHPVMTVVGSIDSGKITDLLTKCPSLDLLGINEYGDLGKIPSWLRKFGWKKPYAVTEWGPTGFWQVQKTAWKVPIEETSSMKAAKYKERYEQTISGDKEMCLGSFVFLWRQHQERTHTWFGMFDANGLETEAVEVMHYEWTGKWPQNRTPRLDSLKIGQLTAYDNVYLQPSRSYTAQVWVREPDNDNIQYNWEVLAEGSTFPYGGNGEKKPEAVPGLISEANKPKISFKSPKKEGSYRLFVYAYDGKGHWATANVPFYVKP